MKYVWAAYKRGSFDHLPEIPKELDPFEFKSVFLALIGQRVLAMGGEVWILEDEIPKGLVNATPSQEMHLEPHVIWFPEATPRNKLEMSMRWLIDMKTQYKIDIFAREGNWRFYDHLCKYGVIRPVGKRRNFFRDDTDAMYYQEVS